MRLLRIVGAWLVLSAGFGVAVWATGGAAAAGGTPTIAADASFNGGSPVLLDFPAPSGGSGSTFTEATAVARQSDGKVVVGGYNGNSSVADFDVARLNANGSLDTSFDTDGYVAVTPVSGAHNYVLAIAIQPDGKIVLAGTTNNFSEMVLVRLNSDGSLDTSFNSGGAQPGILLDNSDHEADALAIDGGGNILVATSGGTVKRYTPSGAADTTFNSTGESSALMGYAGGLALQPDGKIVVAGSTGSSAEVGRLNADGTTDLGFGTSGVTNITPGGDNESVDTVALEGTDILVGGRSASGGLLARLTAAGALDISFGTGGRIVDSSGTKISALFYSPHPVITKVTNDSDESEGDATDDQDSGVCIADPGTGATISCVPSADSEVVGSIQAGAQTVGSNGSTVDMAGSTSDGSHATVSQAVTSDAGGGGTSTSSTTQTTSETCPGTAQPPPCKYDLSVTVNVPATVPPSAGSGDLTHTARHPAAVTLRPKQGARFDGTVNVSNDGPLASTAGKVSVEPALNGGAAGYALPGYYGPPPSPTFYPMHTQVTSTSSQCKQAEAYLIVCTVPALSPGSSVTYSFHVRVSGTDVANANSVYMETWTNVGSPGAEDCNTTVETTCQNNLDHPDTQFEAMTSIKLFGPSEKAVDFDSVVGSATFVNVPGGTPQMNAGGIARVQVAILRLGGKGGSCSWLKSPRGGFVSRAKKYGKKGFCYPTVWLAATGTGHWRFTLSRHLAAGRYAVFARATSKNGLTDLSFGPRLHNEVAFRLK